MEKDAIAVVLHGATGRMGRTIQSLIPEISGVQLRSVLELRDIGAATDMADRDVEVIRQPPKRTKAGEVVVDFSHAAAVEPLMRVLAGSGLPLVCGTTGLKATERKLLEVYSEESPVFYDENMSYGISVLKKLLHVAAPLLLESQDVEIVEYHHRRKADFPSGTALALAQVLAPGAPAVAGRGGNSHSTGTSRERIHIHAVRIGDVPGEHQVHFAGDGEVLTLSHRALSRDVFARGAIRAAQFVSRREKGFFTMSDLLRA